MSNIPEDKYELKRVWSDTLARYEWTLQQIYYVRVREERYSRHVTIIASGNKAWAERTAKHYKIRIENE